MRHKLAENEITVRFGEYRGTTVVKNSTGLNCLDCIFLSSYHLYV